MIVIQSSIVIDAQDVHGHRARLIIP